jgi:hypothetical protein
VIGSSLAAIIATVSVSVSADAASPIRWAGALMPTPAASGIVVAIGRGLGSHPHPTTTSLEAMSQGDYAADEDDATTAPQPVTLPSSVSASPSASASRRPGPDPRTTPPVVPIGGGSLPGPAAKQLTDAGFTDSVGIDIHPTYSGTTYQPDGTADVTLNALERLGVKNVRTRIAPKPSPYLMSFFKGMAADGIKTLGVMGTPDGRFGTYGVGQSRQLLQAVTTGQYKGLVDGLEMPNEWDGNGGVAWASTLHAFDTEYSTTLAASGLPIIGASMAHPDGYASFRAASVTEGRNIHPYSGTAIPESDAVIPAWNAASALTSTNPSLTATEFGWHNATKARGGVTEAQSAAYLLRGLLWNKTHGVSRSYIYELFDERPEPALTNREMHFGLVAVTGNPNSSPNTWRQREKPAFTQLKNLLAYLQDGGTGAGAPASYSLSNAPSDVYAVPMARSDGSTDIAIWRRIGLDSQATNGSATVNLNLGSAASVTAYNTQTGTTRNLGSSTRSVPVAISGAVTIVRVKPAR